MIPVVCDKCGRVGEAEVGRTLPANWEFYRPGDPASPIWCGRCVLELLDSVLAELRAAGQSGRLEDLRWTL